MPNPAEILVADDDPTNRFVLCSLLKTFGFDAVTAADGEEAAQMARDHPPRLILMDISMPRLNGIEAALRIWKERPEPRIPIVAVTANVTSRQRGECDAAGFDGFLPKPIDFDALRGVVEKFAG